MQNTPRTSRSVNALRRRLRPLPLALALLAGGLATPASALDYLWVGGSGSWADAANWSPGGVPGAADRATINNGNHAVIVTGARSVGALALTDGYLGGTGVLNTGSASFGSAVLGLSTSTENTLNVSGAASFNGANVATLRYGQVLNLNGNTTWSAGNGRIDIGYSYAGNATTDPHRTSALNINAGATFTDAGAAAAAGTKQIGYDGGQINNAGTYVCNGLGLTEASHGFNNTGTVNVNAGTFRLTGSTLRSRSSGLVNVAAGAALDLGNVDITAGTIANSGRVQLITNAATTVAAGASINGIWNIGHNSAVLLLNGSHSISALNMTDGYLGGTGVLNTGSASFGSAVLGLSTSTENTLNVSGAVQTLRRCWQRVQAMLLDQSV